MVALKLYYFYQNIYIYIYFSEQVHPTCKRQEKGEENRKLPKGYPEQSQKQYKN